MLSSELDNTNNISWVEELPIVIEQKIMNMYYKPENQRQE